MSETSLVTREWHSSNQIFKLLYGEGDKNAGGIFVKKSFFIRFVFFKYPSEFAVLDDSQWRFYWLEQLSGEAGLEYEAEEEGGLAVFRGTPKEDSWSMVIDCGDANIGCVYFYGQKKDFRKAESLLKESSVWIPLPLEHSWMKKTALGSAALTDFSASGLQCSQQKWERQPCNISYSGSDAYFALSELQNTKFSNLALNFLRGRILEDTNLEISLWDQGIVSWESLAWNSFDWILKLKKTFTERFDFWLEQVNGWEWEEEKRYWLHTGNRASMSFDPVIHNEDFFLALLERECRKIKIFPMIQKITNGYTRVKIFSLKNDGCLIVNLNSGRLYCILEKRNDIPLAWGFEFLLTGLLGDHLIFGKEND